MALKLLSKYTIFQDLSMENDLIFISIIENQGCTLPFNKRVASILKRKFTGYLNPSQRGKGMEIANLNNLIRKILN
jgi:hypothetical protein